jgi:hypothetical protein
MFWEIVCGIALVIFLVRRIALEYRKYKLSQEHVTIFPGGNSFVGRISCHITPENRMYNKESYFSIFEREFKNSIKIIGRIPTTEETIECINTTHPSDAKEIPIYVLIIGKYYDIETIADVCKRTNVSISDINWYDVMSRIRNNFWCEYRFFYKDWSYFNKFTQLRKHGMHSHRSISLPIYNEDFLGWKMTNPVHFRVGFMLMFCLTYDLSPEPYCAYIEHTCGVQKLRKYMEILVRTDRIYTLNEDSVNRMLDCLAYHIDTYHERATLFNLLYQSKFLNIYFIR